MNLDYKNIIKDQFLLLFLPVLAVVLLGYLLFFSGKALFNSVIEYNQKDKDYKELIVKKERVEKQLSQKLQESSDADLKQIVEYEQANIGVSASFAPLFDDMLTIAKESGIRIRSVIYNYTPVDDIIFNAQITGHNVCELQMTVVGKYGEIQKFLKTMAAQPYLINIAQTEIVSWKRDKSILIANLRLRFYTRTK